VKGAAGLVVASGLFSVIRAPMSSARSVRSRRFSMKPCGISPAMGFSCRKANARRRRALNSIVAFETLLFTLQLLEMPFNSSGCFTLAHLCGLLVVLATTHLGKNPAFSQERLKRRRATSNGSLSLTFTAGMKNHLPLCCLLEFSVLCTCSGPESLLLPSGPVKGNCLVHYAGFQQGPGTCGYWESRPPVTRRELPFTTRNRASWRTRCTARWLPMPATVAWSRSWRQGTTSGACCPCVSRCFPRPAWHAGTSMPLRIPRGRG